MKSTLTLAAVFTLLNVQLNIIPNMDLLIIMVVVIIVDFITGIIKAVIKKQARTSEGYKKTVVKFLQYGGGVVCGILLKYLSLHNSNMVQFATFADYLTDGLVLFIIFIEVTSIFENIYAVDKNTPFARYIVKPLLSILTFQIKNNPVAKLDTKNKIKDE